MSKKGIFYKAPVEERAIRKYQVGGSTYASGTNNPGNGASNLYGQGAQNFSMFNPQAGARFGAQNKTMNAGSASSVNNFTNKIGPYPKKAAQISGASINTPDQSTGVTNFKNRTIGVNNVNSGMAKPFSASVRTAPKPIQTQVQGAYSNTPNTTLVAPPAPAPAPQKSAVGKVLSSGGGGASGFKGMSGNMSSGISAVGGMAGSAISSISDGDETKHTGGETASTIGGSVLSGAAGGMAAGPWGMAAGAAVGLVTGLIKNKAKKKDAKANLEVKTAKDNQVTQNRLRTEVQGRDNLLLSGPTSTANQPAAMNSGYGTRGYSRGGNFVPLSFTPSSSPTAIKYIAPVGLTPKKFKRGGSIKPTENIIPNGVLHEEFNDLGDKGMPVVKCKDNTCEKKYEIEKDEMILTLDTTKKVEELVKKGDLKYLGKYVKSQVLGNTHSFAPKFEELNRYSPKNETIFAKD